MSNTKVKPPTIEPRPGGYLLSWDTLGVTARVDRVRDIRGDVIGYVELQSHVPGLEGLLHYGRMNMESASGRRELARDLKHRINHIEWPDLLLQLCTLVVRQFRSGEPVHSFSWDEGVEDVEYLLYPLLPKNHPTVVYGDGDSGKSQLSHLLALCASLPWRENHLGLQVPSRPVPTLILDWETDWEYTKWSIRRLLTGIPIAPAEPNLHYRFCTLPLPDDLEQIQQRINDTGAELLIIDSAALACPGDPNDPEPVLAFFRALRQLNVTSLIIGHTSKTREEHSEKTMYGSAFWRNSVRQMWSVKSTQDESADTLSLALYNRKANMSKRFREIGFRFCYWDEGKAVTVDKFEVETIGELFASLPLHRQIEDILSNGAMSVKEIADELGASEANVRTTLNRNTTKFVKTPTGKWGLRAHELWVD